MTEELKHIPTLRFPEFRDSGEWIQKPLENVLDYEQPTKYIVDSDKYKEAGTPVLTANKSLILGYTDETYNIYNTLPVIIFDDFTADSKYIDFPFKIKSSAIKLLTVKCNREDNLRFIFEAMQLIPFEAKEHKRHYISEFQKQKISVPQNSTEQKKIADCLSSLDNYINATQEKIELFQAHKKGLMQQLLPGFGHSMPQKRLSKFEKSKEWNQAQLKDIATSFSGGTPNVLNKDFYNGDIPFIRSGEINKAETELFLSDLALQKSSAKRVIKGTILYALYGATSGDVAISQIDGAINQAILAIIPNNKMSNIFLFYTLAHQKETIRNKFLQGGQGNLSGQIIKNLSISFPCLSEQKNIAECFTTIDYLIDKTTQKLVMLQKHKQGLIQQLFPRIK